MKSTTAVRIAIVIVAFTLVSLWASPVEAQSNFTMSLQIGGTTYAGGAIAPSSFVWGPATATSPQGVSPELNVTLAAEFVDSVALMEAAQSKQLFATAELQELLLGTVVIDIQMTDVHVESVRIAADNNPSVNPGQPNVILTLKFKSVVYTFQPFLPNGQKNGPPVTFSAQFH